MIKKQFTIYLENKPGALAMLTNALSDARVNIEGISVSGSMDVGLVQIVPANEEKTKKVLNDCGMAYTEQDVAVELLKNEHGALYEVLARLEKKGVNVNYVYATGCSGENECKCYTVISAPRLDEVVEALK